MSAPSLEAFFAAQARFFAAARDPQAAARALGAEFPGWVHRPSRVAIYADFVHGHVRVTLERVFEVTRDALPAGTWSTLVGRFYDTRPAAAYEINQLAAGFPALLAEAGDLDLPPWLPALARLEWALFAAHTAPVELPTTVERLTLNPTAEALEHAWRLCAYREAPPPRTAPPAPGDEVALVWRHPRTLRSHYMAANARTLLAVKLAAEGIAPEDAAAAGGVPVDNVHTAIAEHVGHGLLLAPQG